MMNATLTNKQSYILGIDLGSGALGWAAIAKGQDGAAMGLLRAGVRIFNPAVTGDIDRGLDESNAVARRAARLSRRQLRRRGARRRQLFRLLQRHGLLPDSIEAEANTSRERHLILNSLDLKITSELVKSGRIESRTAVEMPLYFLRKAALDGPLEPFELGRVFYHLSQRRGYRPNRKEKATKHYSVEAANTDDDLGLIEQNIKTLMEDMRNADARTLGEYFASLDPHRQKVRRRWTGRKMYEDEFAAIWAKQTAYMPKLLTEDLRREMTHLLFDQRPMKDRAHLVGGCELEPGKRRTAWATLEAQQFRLLQKLNSLEIILPDQINKITLTQEQRQLVFNLLQNSAEVSFKKIRSVLGLAEDVGFSLQRRGETKLKGNLTNAHMAIVFGERWHTMSDDDKMQVVEDWRTIELGESLIRRAIEHWKIDESRAIWLASCSPPSGFCSLSRKAIRKLLPLMMSGAQFQSAKKHIYGNGCTGGQCCDRIPPVRAALRTPLPPAIERSFTELRKVVNALVAEHGKPDEIRIGIARDLNKPRHERAQSFSQKRNRERERDVMRNRIVAEFGQAFDPSMAEIEKALLFEECGGECPYTGRRFPFSSLFEENSPWRVEHIIPLSRVPDDSFQNKTLCYVEESPHKSNRTPFEAYKDTQQYDAICNRVHNWKKRNPGKLRRFQLKTSKDLEEFSSRLFNDTRYASKLACEFLGTLYGTCSSRTQLDSKQVVFASSAKTTATLRKGWGLETVLHEAPLSGGLKNDVPHPDHRHHAIDAITIGLAQSKSITALTSDNTNTESPCWPGAGYNALEIHAPWRDFVDTIRPHFEQMLISCRQEHRLSGALHAETNYGRPRKESGKNIVHIRKPLQGLSSADIENIVDPQVREAVREKASEFGGDLRKWSPDQEKEDWPRLQTKAGKSIPIRRVRIKKVLDVTTIAEDVRMRHVALSNNHHIAVFALLDGRDREKRWLSEIVSLYEAMDRKRKRQPIIQAQLPSRPEAIFKFSLMWGDILLLHKDCEHDQSICKPSLWRVRSIWGQGTLVLIRIHDARPMNEIRATRDWLIRSPNALRVLNPVKVVVDPLGRIRNAGG